MNDMEELRKILELETRCIAILAILPPPAVDDDEGKAISSADHNRL